MRLTIDLQDNGRHRQRFLDMARQIVGTHVAVRVRRNRRSSVVEIEGVVATPGPDTFVIWDRHSEWQSFKLETVEEVTLL